MEYGEKKSAVTVGNLGDSRAVAGKFRGGKMMVEGLSEDHSVATSPSERDRLRKEFPDLPAIITMGDAELEEHEMRAMAHFKAMLHMKIFQSTGDSLLDAATAGAPGAL